MNPVSLNSLQQVNSPSSISTTSNSSAIPSATTRLAQLFKKAHPGSFLGNVIANRQIHKQATLQQHIKETKPFAQDIITAYNYPGYSLEQLRRQGIDTPPTSPTDNLNRPLTKKDGTPISIEDIAYCLIKPNKPYSQEIMQQLEQNKFESAKNAALSEQYSKR